jgi:hypothetical protein
MTSSAPALAPRAPARRPAGLPAGPPSASHQHWHLFAALGAATQPSWPADSAWPWRLSRLSCGWAPSLLALARLGLDGRVRGHSAGPAACHHHLIARRLSTFKFQSTVVYNLGPAGIGPRWNCRTAIPSRFPTLVAFDPIRAFAVRLGLSIEPWLFYDRALGPLKACQGRWRPVTGVFASDPRARAVGGVPSIADSVAAFNQFVRPLERAQGTRSKYVTHRLSILTWTVWKGGLPQLLPMSDDLLRAYLWDSLTFEASVPMLKHAVDAVKGWHRRLGMPVPMDDPGAYRSVINSLRRFQPVPRILKFPIHKFVVRRLLTVSLPPHPPCAGVKPPHPRGLWSRCPI